MLTELEQELFAQTPYAKKAWLVSDWNTLKRDEKYNRLCVMLEVNRLARLIDEKVLFETNREHGRIYKIHVHHQEKAKHDVTARRNRLATSRITERDVVKFQVTLPRSLADRLMQATGQTSFSKAVESFIDNALQSAEMPVVAAPEILPVTKQGEFIDLFAKRYPWLYGVCFVTLSRVPVALLSRLIKAARGYGFHYYTELGLDSAGEALRADIRDAMTARSKYLQSSSPFRTSENQNEIHEAEPQQIS